MLQKPLNQMSWKIWIFSDDVVVEKEEKQKPKKLSRRDKLKMLSN